VGFASSTEVAVVGDAVLRALVEHFVPQDRPIESMRIRLAFCATDLIAGRTTYISHGSLHDGLMAACAVPGLFPPQRLGSKLLVDGSLAGELPVAAATSIAGSAGVIGCYLEGPEIVPSSFDSGIAVAARVAAIRERELVCEQTRVCDAVLRIPVKDTGWMGFARCGAAARAGQETAMRELGPSMATLHEGAHPLSGPEVFRTSHMRRSQLRDAAGVTGGRAKLSQKQLAEPTNQ
jgi:predicted acylesterase/phospholipase RssA